MLRRIHRLSRLSEPYRGVPAAVLTAVAAALLAPASVVLGRWKERGRFRRRPGEWRPEGDPDGDPDGEGPVRLAAAVAGAVDAAQISAFLLEEVRAVPGVDIALLAFVDEDGARVTGFAADGADASWWRSVTVDLEQDAAGIATAARERAAFAVYDLDSASRGNRELASSIGGKSAAFVPLLVEGVVVGVLVAVSTDDRRFFSSAELEVLQELADVVAPTLEKTRSADALRRALEREKVVAEIARTVRSELDLDSVLAAAVAEAGRAFGVSRCFIRIGGPGEEMPLAAEWSAPGLEPISVPPERLAVSNLALRDRRTVAIGDVLNAPELDDPAAGGRDGLLSLGTRSVLSTPIVVFDRTIGVFALHRGETGAWSTSEIASLEAVAGEVGLAIHAARLLGDDERRLGQQSALLKAAQVVTSDLRFDSVLHRLVDEVATLFGADAADCWMFDPGGASLRCRAVFGLPDSELGRRIPPAGTHAAAIESRRPVLKRDFSRFEDPPPSKSFADFEEVMVAPMTWLGEVRGVLGVCSRESGRFYSSELELLDAFARFASLASHNAESFEERERQARVQQGFYEIAQVLGSPLSLAETLDALARAAADALGGNSAVVLQPNGQGVRMAGSHELTPALAERLAKGLPPSATPFPAAAEDERIISASDLAEDDRFDDATRALLVEDGYTALLSAPVQRTAGANVSVVVLFRSGRSFSDDDLALARHLSRAARGALERSELFEAERRARNLSQRLATVGARLVTKLEPGVILDEVVREAPTLVGADAAAIRLLEGEDLVVRAAAGAGVAGLVGTHASSGVGLLGDVVQARQPETADDARAAPQLGRGDPLLADTMASCVAVPMSGHSGAIHGILSVYGASPRVWRPDEVQALVALAAMASAALSNAGLYQRVAEEKERSEAILGNIADGIVATDREGEIVLWNSMAEQITGVPATEALGRRVSEVLQRDLSAGAGESAVERELSIVRGGKEVWLSVTEAVMRDTSRSVVGRIFAFRDVSSERAVEQMKSDFVATVSHELRTPLTSIYGFAETLLRQDVAFGEEERETFLRYIASESERLIAIVDDLLNVARLEAGTLGLTVRPTDVARVVADTVEEVSSSVDGHRFVVDLPEGGLLAAADPARLTEVVRHLVDNAVRFSPDGGTITIAGRRKSDAVELRVVDEGVGISPGDQQRIFTKFYRASDVGPATGTGVGLFLVRGLLAAMRGRIWVESQEGEGSSFVFELPVSNDAAAGTE